MATQPASNKRNRTGANNAPASQQTPAQLAAANGKFSGIQGVCAICGKPIAITNTTGVGATCTKHIGLVGKHYQALPPNANIAPTAKIGNAQFVPQGASHISVVQLCNYSQQLGKSRGYAVKLCGQDAGVRQPTQPAFTVYTSNGRKYVSVAALAALKALVTGNK